MKLFPFLVTAVLSCHWCFAGQPDAGAIETGEWSEPVSDGDGHTLRGRLVVCDARPDRPATHARVYLELEHTFKSGFSNPLEIYYDWAGKALKLDVRDAQDKPVPQTPISVRGPMPEPCWITLPCDSTMRLRGDIYTLSMTPEPAGLQIFVGSGNWIIPTDAAGEFYLSGTFSPPADHPSALSYHVWQGTLKLPKVKIPPRKVG